MDAKHTGGEWFARSGLTQLCAEDATTLCQVGPAAADGSFWWVFSTVETHGDAEATARLIAAAPDLLASLIELEDVLGRMNESGECGHTARLKRARAAVAKAAA
jgi:hypothetical protein